MNMSYFTRATAMAILAAGPFLLIAACTSGNTQDGTGANGGNGGAGAGTSSSDSSTGTGSGQTCEDTCTSPDDCFSVTCDCNDGTSVNNASCLDGCCGVADAVCPGACADNGGWVNGGSNPTGGGGSSTSGGGGGTSQQGEPCITDDDCASKHCFEVFPDSTAKQCTIECTFDNPEACGVGWDCAKVTDVGGNVTYLCVRM